MSKWNWSSRLSPLVVGALGLVGLGEQAVRANSFALIHDIQGSGPVVTGAGPFTVEAIVVGSFQGSDQLRGFFIQEEDADVDANPATSEGIFVYCNSCTTPVSVGDKVQVTGSANEYYQMSQLNATSVGSVVVVSSGNSLPSPAVIHLPAVDSTRDETTFENVEGMLVTFPDPLYVSEYYDLARYGQLLLSADERPRQFTDAYSPSVPGFAAYWNALNSRRIILDDDNNVQNDAIAWPSDKPYFWPRAGLSIDNYLRGGDSISGLTGVMHWSNAGPVGTEAWRVRPVEPEFTYSFTRKNERPMAPADVGGSLKIASFNLLNYFTTLGLGGADSIAELDRQREKLAAAICGLNADVVGLIEIQNNAGQAVADLLNGPNGINTKCGPYASINTGVVGSDVVTAAFIYRPSTVTPVGNFAVLNGTVDPRFNDVLNRPALAQTFQDKSTGGIFTMVVTELKSKTGSCAAAGDPNTSDGQSNCNLTRRNAALAMVDWLATDPTGSGSGNFLIMGNLNSYRNEDPITAIKAGSDDTAGTTDDFTDLIDSWMGPSAYGLVYDGQLGYLQTALASSGLVGKVNGVTFWHINADEIPLFDYNDVVQNAPFEFSYERESSSLPLYEPNAYRSAEHDPVLVGLSVCDDSIPPTLDKLTFDSKVLWPPNHKYRDVAVTAVASDNFDPNPQVKLLSVRSNEPDDAPGKADGTTTNDIVIVDDFHFKLRAERSDLGAGRVYTFTYQATDKCGNSAIKTGTVLVPLKY